VPSDNTQTILLIDDSQAVLDELKNVLTQAGFNVVATSQTVGIARHLRHCELVIIDFHMPGRDGKTVLESLKGAAQSIGTTPLFYLYTSDASLGGQYRQLGFDGAFTQKGSADALVRQVEAVFRLQRLRGLSRPK
jgi:DNA-binding NarL/FixJ family response regulator